jgi:hypothetical protein
MVLLTEGEAGRERQRENCGESVIAHDNPYGYKTRNESDCCAVRG